MRDVGPKEEADPERDVGLKEEADPGEGCGSERGGGAR